MKCVINIHLSRIYLPVSRGLDLDNNSLAREEIYVFMFDLDLDRELDLYLDKLDIDLDLCISKSRFVSRQQ